MRERVGVGEKSSGTTYCRKKVRRMQQGGHAGRKRDSLRMCCWHWALWTTQAACAWPVCVHVPVSCEYLLWSICIFKTLIGYVQVTESLCGYGSAHTVHFSVHVCSCCVLMHMHSAQQQVVFPGLMKPGGGHSPPSASVDQAHVSRFRVTSNPHTPLAEYMHFFPYPWCPVRSQRQLD